MLNGFGFLLRSKISVELNVIWDGHWGVFILCACFWLLSYPPTYTYTFQQMDYKDLNRGMLSLPRIQWIWIWPWKLESTSKK